ncbi:MAG: DUF2391 family protein [Campylobacterales bacterium]
MKKLYFNFEDIGQIAIGAFALGVPVSFSQEAWDMGATLSWYNLALVFLLSIGFLTLFSYQSIFQGSVKNRIFVYVFRVFAAYMLTLAVVILLLFAIDKFPIITDPIIALKRVIIIAMPASMGAIIVDSIDKE